MALYTGTSLTSPAGLSRIVSSTNTTSVTGVGESVATVAFGSPVDLPVGQIFYAALLIRTVPGTLFPFADDSGNAASPAPLGRSFFDVGATQGGTYDLDVTSRATVLGGSHPVVTQAQSAGNAAIRVNAIPAPAGLGLLALGGLVAGPPGAGRRGLRFLSRQTTASFLPLLRRRAEMPSGQTARPS